jgi:hypothetical protein
MSRTLDDFLADFNLLMDHYHLHQMYFDHETIVTPDEIRNIVNGAVNGEKDSLERIPIVKQYFEHYKDMITYQLNDRRNWQYYYPELEPDEPEPEFDPYTADVEKLEIMRRILIDLNKPVAELFGIMKPTEMMALTSMSRQMPRQLPEDLKKYTGEFLGKESKGGKHKTRKHKTRGKKTKKGKSKRHYNKRR